LLAEIVSQVRDPFTPQLAPAAGRSVFGGPSGAGWSRTSTGIHDVEGTLAFTAGASG